MPVEMEAAITTVINGRVYVGGGGADGDECCLMTMYDPVKNEWGTLPPATVVIWCWRTKWEASDSWRWV